MRCDKCDNREKCIELCPELEAELQTELLNKEDAFNRLYERPYDPEELFKRFHTDSKGQIYNHLGFSSSEEATETLKAVIKEKLTKRQIFILDLYYKSGLTQKQIALLLNRKQHTIADSLKRSRKKLQKHMEFLVKTSKIPTK